MKQNYRPASEAKRIFAFGAKYRILIVSNLELNSLCLVFLDQATDVSFVAWSKTSAGCVNWSGRIERHLASCRVSPHLFESSEYPSRWEDQQELPDGSFFFRILLMAHSVSFRFRLSREKFANDLICAFLECFWLHQRKAKSEELELKNTRTSISLLEKRVRLDQIWQDKALFLL